MLEKYGVVRGESEEDSEEGAPKKVTTKDLAEMQHSIDKKKLRGKSGPPGPSISPGSSTKKAPKYTRK